MLKVITLFSGYDSQCLALNRLGVEYDLVAWCEIDRHAITAHNALFPQWADRNLGDVSKVNWGAIEKPIDLLTYSSPCQDFSNAGLQRGGEEGSGTRSGLLWEVEKAIDALRPKYLVFENVAALVSEKFLPTFNKWQVRLNNYGYTNFCQVMNAKDYGVPQNRQRIFMVSVHDCDRAYYFPKPFKLERRLKDVLEKAVDERYYLSEERVKGLLLSTEKEKDAGRGFEFAPLTGEEKVGRSVTTNAGCRKTDNFIAEPTVEVIGDLDPDNKRRISGSIRQQNMVVGCNGISPCIPASNFKHEFKVAEPAVEVVGNLQPENNWQGSVIRQQNVVVGSEGISPCITELHSHHAFKVAEPRVQQIGNLIDEDSRGFNNPQDGRVYSADGISPSVLTCQGGNKVPKIAEPQVLGWTRNEKREITDRHPVSVANCVTSGKRDNTQNYVMEPQIASMKSRDKDNPTGVRTANNGNFAQRLELGPTDTSNTLISVAKDNLLVIPQATKEGYAVVPDGGVFDGSYPNSKTRRGRVQENGEVAPTVMSNQNELYRYEGRVIEPYDYIYYNQSDDFQRPPLKNIGRTIKADSHQPAVAIPELHGIRIRRLTERELYRLMDVDEKDIDTLLASDIARTQHSKLAGNSIVVACLYYIFKNLFTDTVEAGTQTRLF